MFSPNFCVCVCMFKFNTCLLYLIKYCFARCAHLYWVVCERCFTSFSAFVRCFYYCAIICLMLCIVYYAGWKIVREMRYWCSEKLSVATPSTMAMLLFSVIVCRGLQSVGFQTTVVPLAQNVHFFFGVINTLLSRVPMCLLLILVNYDQIRNDADCGCDKQDTHTQKRCGK